ncbi:MAG: hypothetical protein JNM36_18120 [Chitinophagales bacterium]|nr:hypothetical protein [Chitinophagales bacterium]
MQKFLILLNLALLSAAELVKKAFKVATGIENNSASLTNINPTAEEIRAEAENLDALLQQEDALESELKSLQQKSKNSRDKLNALLKSAGSYIEIVANQQQSAALISGCGFDLRAENTITTSLGVPNNLRLQEVLKTSGMLSVIFDSVDKARNYGLIWAYGSAPPAEWAKQSMLIITSSRNNKIAFERGQTVWVRVKAYGPNNTESDWSDVATRIVP